MRRVVYRKNAFPYHFSNKINVISIRLVGERETEKRLMSDNDALAKYKLLKTIVSLSNKVIVIYRYDPYFF